MLEIGKVAYWDAHGLYGFINLPWGRVFVHYRHGYRVVIDDIGKPNFCKEGTRTFGMSLFERMMLPHPKNPEVGDTLIFQTVLNAKGYMAESWAYHDEWLEAELAGPGYLPSGIRQFVSDTPERRAIFTTGDSVFQALPDGKVTLVPRADWKPLK